MSSPVVASSLTRREFLGLVISPLSIDGLGKWAAVVESR
jgi:hypothetical protein